MIKTYISKLRNGTAKNDVRMLENTANGIMCAIHSTVNSASNFPRSQHKVVKICPGPNRCCQQSPKLTSPRTRIKRRSKSPKEPNSIEPKSAPCCKDWSTKPRDSSTCRCQNAVDQIDCLSRICTTPTCPCRTLASVTCPSPNCPSRKCSFRTVECSVPPSPSFVHVEKANSCPERTCSCISRSSTNSTSKASNRCFVKSHSTLQVGNVLPLHAQIAQRIICTDGVVTELKDEIEKVKSQLHQFNICRRDKLKFNIPYDKSDPQKLIAELKTENKQLKKELIQKKKLQQASAKNVEKAKDIMNDYEKKVGLLHEQAIKSSKVMKQSKERFCKCLRDKEQMIKDLQRHNEGLQGGLREEAIKNQELTRLYEHVQELCDENNGNCLVLSGNNQKYAQCIDVLEKQLQCAECETQRYKEDITRLQQEISNIKCNTCQKLEVKMNKQKEKYDDLLKETEVNENIYKNQISELYTKVKELEVENLTVEKLQCKCNELQEKLVENEKCVSKCKQLEDKCRRQCETTLQKEERYEKERDEMRNLVDELTTVVKQNKVTLLQLSNINKQQESMLESQCSLLSEKEEKIRLAESTIEMMESKSSDLEKEVEELRKSLTGPCTKETCCVLSKELKEIKAALIQERDNQLMKQKIIEDQSETICCLQYQIKEKMSELSKAREETSMAEDEMMRINDDLIRKHKDLERELDEKENLLDKMRKLEFQKTQLSYEMSELERLLQRYCETQQHDEKQHSDLLRLQKQVELQRREWETQKEKLAIEKEKAVCAAKFATQKLLDTVSDFQKQVDTQKKVQTMLTKMLHNKEEELKTIKSKMSSINTIATGLKPDISMKELYKRSKVFDLSNPTTTTSFYSSCSNCSKSAMKSIEHPEQTDLQKLFYLLTSTDDEPIRESSS